MLAASRLDFGGRSLTMGVYQEIERFSDTADQASVYFVGSPGYLVRHALEQSERENREVVRDEIRTDEEVTALKYNSKNESTRSNDTDNIGNHNADQGRTSAVNQPCVRPKYGAKIIGLPDKMAEEEEDKRKNKKKKKWRTVGAEEMGFRLSLFPRTPVTVEEGEAARETNVFFAVMEEFDNVTEKSRPFSHLLQLEGSGVCREDKVARKDSDRRVRKAHVQVKSKHITSVLNNRGRKTLYIHFRLYKMFPFLHCYNHSHPNLPSPPRRQSVCMEVARSAVKAQTRAAVVGWGGCPRGSRRGAPPQDLTHALHNDNVPGELPTDVISFLINLQHREMTPEDYEMLLRLDEGIAPKTVEADVLQNFKTDVVGPASEGEECAVCMEQYEVGQNRKFLPCGHAFHVQCIDMWLNNSSQNCPLDGLPVDPP